MTRSRSTALVLGVANNRSIAWSCVKTLWERNLNVIFTVQNDRFQQSADKLIQQTIRSNEDGPALHALPCNVATELPNLFEERIPSIFDSSDFQLDTIVHSIAYASASSMKEGNLLNTTKSDFLLAHEISVYSFLELAQLATSQLHLRENGSLTALSYLGAVQAVSNYNIMGPAKASLEAMVRGLALELGADGFRVNAVSAGPVSTMAARGIANFDLIKADVKERAPLRRNVTPEEVAKTVAFVSCDAAGMTGQTVYVDSGYSAARGPAVSQN